MTKGTVVLTYEDISGGFRIIKTLNICADTNGFIYVNAESIKEDNLYGDEWMTLMDTRENYYKVHIGLTLDEVLTLYKRGASDTVVWITPMTEVS